MTDLLIFALAVLSVAFTAALLVMLGSKESSDRMLSVQLLGTNGVGMLLLFSWVLEIPALLDVALVIALLAAVAVIAFTRRDQEGRHV